MGAFTESDFELQTGAIPTPGEGEILVRSLYLSLDPTHRLWAREEATYMPPVGLGEVMRGFILGRVVESNNPDFPEGSLVSGVFGWQEYSVSDCTGADLLARVEMDERLPLISRFTLFEHIGLTAYFGILDVLKTKPGDTVVISAAAGAVGSIATQIAKLQGARVVAVAGSDDKCRWLSEELGADVTINYRTQDLPDAVREACPDGVDGFFDNVGGEILDAVLENLALHATIAMVGAISQYEKDGEATGPSNFYSLLNQRARIHAFMIFDYLFADPDAWAKAHDDITAWAVEGKLKYRVDMIDGLENAPAALGKLFSGTNTGKLVVKVADDES